MFSLTSSESASAQERDNTIAQKTHVNKNNSPAEG